MQSISREIPITVIPKTKFYGSSKSVAINLIYNEERCLGGTAAEDNAKVRTKVGLK